MQFDIAVLLCPRGSREGQILPLSYFDSISIRSGGVLVETLPSALLYSLEHLSSGDPLEFCGSDKHYCLPLLPRVPARIGFFCLFGVQNKRVFVAGAHPIFCRFDRLVVHSSTRCLRVRVDDEPRELRPYRLCETGRAFPASVATPESRWREGVIRDALSSGVPLLLEGETSSGKTFAVESVCCASEIPLVRYNCSETSTLEELIGDISVLSGSRRVVFKEGPFARAWIRGLVLLVDELSLCGSSLVQSIVSHLSSEELLLERVGGCVSFPRNASFRLVATQNPASSRYRRTKFTVDVLSHFRCVQFERLESRELEAILSGLMGRESLSFDGSSVRSVVSAFEAAQARERRSGAEGSREFTLRDCLRVRSMVLKGVPLASALSIAFGEALPSGPSPPRPASVSLLDEGAWSRVVFAALSALESGSHVILSSPSEFAARECAYALTRLVSASGSLPVVHCSSSTGGDSLIGGFVLRGGESGSLSEWVDSELLACVKAGGVCVLQSMDRMRSNQIERLNNLLEVVPTDGAEHRVRFDECGDQQEFVLHPTFRIVATASESRLRQLSPALRNRFVTIRVEASAVPDAVSVGAISVVGPPRMEERRQRSWSEALVLANRQLSAHASELQQRSASPEQLRFLFNMTVGSVDEIALSAALRHLVGTRASCVVSTERDQRTDLVDQLLQLVGGAQKRLFLSSDTEVGELAGHYSTETEFCEGLLLGAVRHGGTLVIEEAQRLSVGLLESLEQFYDLLLDSVVHHGRSIAIHPRFRLLFLVSGRETPGSRHLLSSALPRVELAPRALASVPVAPFAESVASFAQFGAPGDEDGDADLEDAALSEALADARLPRQTESIVARVARRHRGQEHFVIALFLQSEQSISSYRASFPSVEAFLREPVKLLREGAAFSLEKGPLHVVLGNRAPRRATDPDVLELWLRLSLLGLEVSGSGTVPLLLVGDPSLSLEVVREFYSREPSLIEVSGSLEAEHLIGSTIFASEREILSVLGSAGAATAPEGSALRSWFEAQQPRSEGLRARRLFFRPGALVLALLRGASVVLNGLHQLKESLVPRVDCVLSGSVVTPVLYEDYESQLGELLHPVPMLAVCSPESYWKTPCRELFVEVSLPLSAAALESAEERHQRWVSECLSEELSSNARSRLLVRFLEGDSLDRRRLESEVSSDSTLHALLYPPVNESFPSDYFSTMADVVGGRVSSDVQQTVDTSQLYPVCTTLQMLLALSLSTRCSLPLLLEGEPGIGKSECARCFFRSLGVAEKRILRFNLSQNVTLEQLLGGNTIENGTIVYRRSALLELLESPGADDVVAVILDEFNLAPLEVLEALSILIRASLSNDREYQVPGYRSVRLPRVLFVCTMNPASVSSNRAVLPASITDCSLFFRDIDLRAIELNVLGGKILLQDTLTGGAGLPRLVPLFAAATQLARQTRTSFTLRDAIKAREILRRMPANTELSVALWVVFACKYSAEDAAPIQRALGLLEMQTPRLRLTGRGEAFFENSPWQFTIDGVPGGFDERCFLSSEEWTALQLSLCYPSGRAVILYGPSPSGKSFAVRRMSELWSAHRLLTVPLTSESTPSLLLGRYEPESSALGDVQVVFRRGPLLLALELGCWLCIENIHLASSDVLERLNSLCEDSPELNVIECEPNLHYCDRLRQPFPAGSLVIHPDFRLFLTSSASSMSSIPTPLLSRCVVLHTRSLNSARSIQEYCLLKRDDDAAGHFRLEGADAAMSDFRRAKRFLERPDEASFHAEYPGASWSQRFVVLSDFSVGTPSPLSLLMASLRDVRRGRAVAHSLLSSQLRSVLSLGTASFSEHEVRDLDQTIAFLRESLVAYPLFCLSHHLHSRLGQNEALLREDGWLFAVLRAWLSYQDYHPVLQLLPGGGACSDGAPNPLVSRDALSRHYRFSSAWSELLVLQITNRLDEAARAGRTWDLLREIGFSSESSGIFLPAAHVEALFTASEALERALSGLTDVSEQEDAAHSRVLESHSRLQPLLSRVEGFEYISLRTLRAEYDRAYSEMNRSWKDQLIRDRARIHNEHRLQDVIDFLVVHGEDIGADLRSLHKDGLTYEEYRLYEPLRSLARRPLLCAKSASAEASAYVELGYLLQDLSSGQSLVQYYELLHYLPVDRGRLWQSLQLLSGALPFVVALVHSVMNRLCASGEGVDLDASGTLEHLRQRDLQVHRVVSVREVRRSLLCLARLGLLRPEFDAMSDGSPDLTVLASEVFDARATLPRLRCLEREYCECVDGGHSPSMLSLRCALNTRKGPVPVFDVSFGSLVPSSALGAEFEFRQRESSEESDMARRIIESHADARVKLQLLSPRARSVKTEFALSLLSYPAYAQLCPGVLASLGSASEALREMDSAVRAARESASETAAEERLACLAACTKLESDIQSKKEQQARIQLSLDTARSNNWAVFNNAFNEAKQRHPSIPDDIRLSFFHSLWNRMVSLFNEVGDPFLQLGPIVGLTQDSRPPGPSVKLAIIRSNSKKPIKLHFNQTKTAAHPFTLPEDSFEIKGREVVIALPMSVDDVTLESRSKKPTISYKYVRLYDPGAESPEAREKMLEIVKSQLRMAKHRQWFYANALPIEEIWRVAVRPPFSPIEGYPKEKFALFSSPKIGFLLCPFSIDGSWSAATSFALFEVRQAYCAAEVEKLIRVREDNPTFIYLLKEVMHSNCKQYEGEVEMYNAIIPVLAQLRGELDAEQKKIRALERAGQDLPLPTEITFPPVSLTQPRASVARDLFCGIVVTGDAKHPFLLPFKNEIRAPPLFLQWQEATISLPLLNPQRLPVEVSSSDMACSLEENELVLSLLRRPSSAGETSQRFRLSCLGTSEEVVLSFPVSEHSQLIHTEAAAAAFNRTVELVWPSRVRYRNESAWVERFVDKLIFVDGIGIEVKKDKTLSASVISDHDFIVERGEKEKDSRVHALRTVFPRDPNLVPHGFSLPVSATNRFLDLCRSVTPERDVEEYLSSFRDLRLLKYQSGGDVTAVLSVLESLSESDRVLELVRSLARRELESITCECPLEWRVKSSLAVSAPVSAPAVVAPAASGVLPVESVAESVDADLSMGERVEALVSGSHAVGALVASMMQAVSLEGGGTRLAAPEPAAPVRHGGDVAVPSPAGDEALKTTSSQALRLFEGRSLESYFTVVMGRSAVVRCVEPSSRGSSRLQRVPLVGRAGAASPDVSSLLSLLFSVSFPMSREIQSRYSRVDAGHRFVRRVSLVLDLNWTLRGDKARLRSLVSCALLQLAQELAVKVQVLAVGGGLAAEVAHEGTGLLSCAQRIIDLEHIRRVPSSPMDVVRFSEDFDGQATETRYVLLTDGLSEQLLSPLLREMTSDAERASFHVLLLCGSGEGDSLSVESQALLEESLRANFVHVSVVSVLPELVELASCEDASRSLYGLFVSSATRERNESAEVLSAPRRPLEDAPLDLSLPERCSCPPFSVVLNSSLPASAVRFPQVSDRDLEQLPAGQANARVMRELNESVASGVLFRGLDATLLPPNRPTSYVASSTGSSIHLANFIKFALTGLGDGRFFKKKTGNKTRSYSVSLVVDGSARSLSPFNRGHLLCTLLTLLRALSEFQLSEIDVWVSGASALKVASGVDSETVWSDELVSSLLGCLQQPAAEGAVESTLRHAIAQCQSRPSTPLLLFLGSGLLEARDAEAVSGLLGASQIAAVCIGTGLSVFGLDRLFPAFVYSPDPSNLGAALLSVQRATREVNLSCGVSESAESLRSLLSAKQRNIVAGAGFSELQAALQSPQSEYDLLVKRYGNERLDDMDSITVNRDEMELGRDNAFRGAGALFVVLYLGSGQRGPDGEEIDKEITRVRLEGDSPESVCPVKKLERKGLLVRCVYDYASAIEAICSGQFHCVLVTCSRGDGVFPGSRGALGLLECFLECLERFQRSGGGLFWFLENGPYSFEADAFFKRVHGVESLCDENALVPGGKSMARDCSCREPAPGRFMTVGSDVSSGELELRLDKGLTSIHEGVTLACVDEEALQLRGFEVFARESEGSAAILIHRGQRSLGRTIVDTAASKLFMEFTTEGTSHWISNGVIWLMNLVDVRDGEEIPPLPRQEVALRLDRSVRPRVFARELNYCVSLVVDCTDSMQPYIDGTKRAIRSIFDELKALRSRAGLGESSQIVGQFVGFRDYCDRIPFLESGVLSNFDDIYLFLRGIVADGGGDFCEDVLGGVDSALQHVSELDEFAHLVLIIGDAANHGDDDGDDYPTEDPNGVPWARRWDSTAERLRELNADVCFLEVGESIEYSRRRLCQHYHPGRISSRSIDEASFLDVLESVITQQYRLLAGIAS